MRCFSFRVLVPQLAIRARVIFQRARMSSTRECKLALGLYHTLNLCSCFKVPSRSAKTRRMRDQQCYRANADKYKEAAREAYESSTERNFKGGGQKGS